MNHLLLVPDHPGRKPVPWMETWLTMVEHAAILRPESFVYNELELWTSAIIEEMNNMPEPRILVSEGLGAMALAHALSHEEAVHVEGCMMINPLIGADLPNLPIHGFDEFPQLPATRDVIFVCGKNFGDDRIQRALEWSKDWGGIFALLPLDEEYKAALHLYQAFYLETAK